MLTPFSNRFWSRFTFKHCALLACLFVFSSSANADVFWTDTAELNDANPVASQPGIRSLPSEGRPVVFDLDALRSTLQNVSKGLSTPTVITFPEPSGASRNFVVKRSRVLPDALAARFPDLLAFEGFAEDDPTITIRFEVDRLGVSAQVLEPGARWMVDPYPKLKDGLAISYYSGKTKRVSHDRFCELESHAHDEDEEQHSAKKHFAAKAAAKSSGTQLRTYRLAVATTGEYGQFHGGETSSVLSAVTTTINRVVGILEKEMSISLVLIDNNDQILFTSPTTDPFTGNDDAGVLIDESQAQIDLIIGSENYDVGHTFSTGAGGLASLGSVCSATRKAQGVTGSSQPRGDYFDVDFVAHELGHQFGGNHTFNGSNGACTGGNRYYLTAYEPGSGSTIQAYPSLCGPDDLQNAVDPIYHSVSFDEMYGFVSEGDGASCGVVEDTANTPPTVDAGNDFNVPYGTPLVITGSATDSEQSNLTFMWEQRDLGPQAALSAPDDGEIPLFRVLTPSDSPTRYLPELSAVLSGNYSSAEKIPQVAREMDFRLTVRDGVGGVSSDDIVVNVSGSAGPFALLSPNGGESVGETTTVTWDVADTNLSPINTESVEILLSTDGGVSFDVSLGTTANDGSATVNFPSNLQTSSARLQIKAQNNIYYDVSDENFVLDSDRSVPPAPVDTAVEPANGGAVVTFSAGPANGVDVTSYVVSCSAEATSQEFMYSAEPGLPFSELAPVSSVLTVTDAITAQANGLKVPVDISHTYRGDVIIELTSPEGTKVRLKSELGSDSGQNVVGTYPDSLAPEESLDLFDGEAAQGDWTLDVSDGFDADSGTFNSWGLTFTSVTPGAEASATGTSSPITVTGMTNGETYQCSITAYSGDDPSETVVIGNVTPSAGTFTVTPEAGAGGSISPSTPQSVTEGATTSFELSADGGYAIDTVGGTCGGALSGSTFTTNAVTQDCTVSATFVSVAVSNFIVTPSAGVGGSISPSTPQTVEEGSTTTFVLTAESGYEIDTVGGTCDGTLSGSTFTTAAITQNCTVTASFAELPPTTYTVTPSAGTGGSISPSTPQTVEEGSTTSFVLTADSGYEIDSVGGSCSGTLSGSTFTTAAITQNCTVTASFTELPPTTYTVTPSAGVGGSISPSTPQTVEEGSTTAFVLTADSGYEIDAVGGTCGGALSGSTFTTDVIVEDCSVEVSFEELVAQTSYIVSVGPATNGTVAIGDYEVGEGETLMLSAIGDAGYELVGVVGTCGGSVKGPSSIETDPVFADCDFSAAFGAIPPPVTYTVTPSAGIGGAISPSTPQAIEEGSTTTFEVTADSGYEIESVGGTCDGTLSGSTFTTAPVTESCTVVVSFALLPTYIVTPSASSGGSISPDTPQSVLKGARTSFSLTPDAGYELEDITGSCGGSLSGTTFTTSPVSKDCTVDVLFRTDSSSDESTEGGLPLWLIYIANEPSESDADPE